MIWLAEVVGCGFPAVCALMVQQYELGVDASDNRTYAGMERLCSVWATRLLAHGLARFEWVSCRIGE